MSKCDKLELLSCVANGSMTRLGELLQAGANPNCLFDDGSSLLHNLAVSESISEKERADVFSLLKEAGAKLEYKNPKGVTALMFAAGGGHQLLVDSMLLQGAKINAKDQNQDSVLIWASSTSKLASLQSLLNAGVDIKHPGSAGRTALMYAARNGNCTYIRELVDAGANLSARNTEGKTALILAAERGHLEATNLILSYDPESAKTLSLSLAASVGLIEIVKSHINAGNELTETNELGFSPLELAAIYKRKEIVELLLPHFTNSRIRASTMSLACLACDEDILKLLIDSGADINFQDENGDTPLILAVSKNFSSGVALLIKNGANKKIKNSTGDDAIDIGQSNKAYDALQLIFNSKD